MKYFCPKCGKKITQDDSRSWDLKGRIYHLKCALKQMPEPNIEEPTTEEPTEKPDDVSEELEDEPIKEL